LEPSHWGSHLQPAQQERCLTPGLSALAFQGMKPLLELPSTFIWTGRLSRNIPTGKSAAMRVAIVTKKFLKDFNLHTLK
jgi:hypothetical protein